MKILIRIGLRAEVVKGPINFLEYNKILIFEKSHKNF